MRVGKYGSCHHVQCTHLTALMFYNEGKGRSAIILWYQNESAHILSVSGKDFVTVSKPITLKMIKVSVAITYSINSRPKSKECLYTLIQGASGLASTHSTFSQFRKFSAQARFIWDLFWAVAPTYLHPPMSSEQLGATPLQGSIEFHGDFRFHSMRECINSSQFAHGAKHWICMRKKDSVSFLEIP